MLNNTNQNTYSEPGFPCPECQAHINIEMGMLFMGVPIKCPACGLQIKLDKNSSHKGLQAIKKLEDGLNKAEEVKNSAMPPSISGYLKKNRRQKRNRKN